MDNLDKLYDIMWGIFDFDISKFVSDKVEEIIDRETSKPNINIFEYINENLDNYVAKQI